MLEDERKICKNSEETICQGTGESKTIFLESFSNN